MGPTGSGKTSSLIQRLRSKPSDPQPLLVSIDAVAVYRGLDIGSAKVMGEERSGFDWVGLDFKNPDQICTVREFLDAVEGPIGDALETGRAVVLVGGSGFYENALVEGLAPGAASDADYQKSLEALANEALHQRLVSFDKRWGEFLHVNDRYRLTRYLDLVERQGFNWKDLRESKRRSPRLQKLWAQTDCVALGLDWPRETYMERLKTRIDEMWRLGWVEEVKNVRKVYGAQAVALQTIGYKEMLEHLEGLPEAATKEKILYAHIQYVKRQKTWIRSLLDS
jgi:tRNA dimethylallyltransferase